LKRSQLSPLGLSLTIVRAINGWTQTALAKASGTGTSQLSQYENGKIRLTQERFDALVAAMHTADGVGELTTSTVALLLSMAGGDAEAPADDLTAEERQAVHASVLRMLRSMGEVLHQGAVAQVTCRRVEAVRQQAAEQWRLLAEHSPAERRLLLEHGLSFQTWAMCLELCDQSVAAASRGAAEAVQLAELALRAAELARGDAGELRRLQGYARGFVGNAHRVAGGLAVADSWFFAAVRSWDEGAQPSGFSLARWPLLEMEASLRWAQQDWPAAAALLDRARQLAPTAEAGRLLVKAGAARQAAGQLEAALAALDEAAPLVAAQPEPRWLAHYHQISCLCQLGRYDEAGECLQRMDATDAMDGEGTLDLVRQMWLRARVAGGRGERQWAIQVLEQVRTELMLAGNGYEAALISIELAVLYQEQGRSGQVRDLARSTFDAFQERPVQREVWEGIVQFCRLADAESIRVDPLRQIHRSLERVRLPLDAAPVLTPQKQQAPVLSEA
jgi:tetratricopeptide (TPR) repeat protein